MIQILGYRPYVDKGGKTRLTEKFFEKEWRADSVIDLFLNIEKHLENIPKEYHWNLHYTLADCHEEPGRKLLAQHVIPFDIDGINVARIKEYINPVCECIGASPNQVGIVASGNGLHFIVGLEQPIIDVKYFQDNRVFYKAIAERINKKLHSLGLSGETDAAVFAPSHTLRLPLTENRKTPEAGFLKKNSVTQCTLIDRVIIPLDYDLAVISGIPKVDRGDAISVKELKKYTAPDTKFVLDECMFLKDCADHPEDVKEGNWYKMLSITARLENGVALSHEMSEGHPDYDEYETDRKIEQSLEASGPRTCGNIGTSYNCTQCPHFQKVVSPITLQGPDYIGTKKNGFRNLKLNANGTPVKGSVNYEDLEKYFYKKFNYITTEDGTVFVWKGTHWEPYADAKINEFIEEYVEPSPMKNECGEFRAKILRRNIADSDFFTDSTFRLVNLKNGVLDLSNGKPELLQHDKKYGFLNTLPYEYDPKAICPRFDKYMEEVTLKRENLVKVLLEYAGYAFANESCVYAKSLILSGGGFNGKSTFIEILQKLAGETAYCNIPLTKFQDEKYLATLQGKLFNLTEETPSKAFMESSSFKNIVSGGSVSVRHLYKKPFNMKSRAKIILACNELPNTHDMTKGMLRRLMIIPFDADFDGAKEDKGIKKKLFQELPGILNRIIEGFYRLKGQQSFTKALEIEAAIDNFRMENDTVLGFYRECLIVKDASANEGSSVSEIYRAYTEYCQDSGISFKFTKNKFSRELRRCVHDLDSRKHRKRAGNKNLDTFYRGIKFSSDNSF